MATGEQVFAELEEFTENSIKKLVINVTANLTEDTPRDTSWARVNWIPSIGSPHRGTAGTAEQAKAFNIDFADQQIGIADVLNSYRIEQGAVHVTNNVPYILKLNDGSSTQAPAGFVEIAIVNAIRDINTGRKKVTFLI